MADSRAATLINPPNSLENVCRFCTSRNKFRSSSPRCRACETPADNGSSSVDVVSDDQQCLRRPSPQATAATTS
ncbi:hypothetical protein C2S51_030067 [Perilla frutescens var. frutescens]|nr:hypothetical protein C2S51_030067 [Perilla frutescens var. frutescens]